MTHDYTNNHLYLIEAVGTSMFKIGRAVDPVQRLQNLQAGSPSPLRLVWAAQAEVQAEGMLHRHFCGRRKSGEWFQFEAGDAVAQMRVAVEALRIELVEVSVDVPSPRKRGPRPMAITKKDRDRAARAEAREAARAAEDAARAEYASYFRSVAETGFLI